MWTDWSGPYAGSPRRQLTGEQHLVHGSTIEQPLAELDTARDSQEDPPHEDVSQEHCMPYDVDPDRELSGMSGNPQSQTCDL